MLYESYALDFQQGFQLIKPQPKSAAISLPRRNPKTQKPQNWLKEAVATEPFRLRQKFTGQTLHSVPTTGHRVLRHPVLGAWHTFNRNHVPLCGGGGGVGGCHHRCPLNRWPCEETTRSTRTRHLLFSLKRQKRTPIVAIFSNKDFQEPPKPRPVAHRLWSEEGTRFGFLWYATHETNLANG